MEVDQANPQCPPLFLHSSPVLWGLDSREQGGSFSSISV